MKRIFLFLVSILSLGVLTAQIPKTYTSSEILQQIKKLKVLGSVLYIAAHPDDENTRLIAYLSNDKLYRTGYLSLTRGDGGQNLIGDEQGAELGLIRTQELLAARRIDGGEQFFSRAIDFGFSKNPKETFRFWNQEEILSDVVWVIRKFQPDVIIARFPEDGRAGHGQHSASGIMARLGYVAAASADSFPGQFSKGAQVWQAKRMLWNTFNFGSFNTTDSTQFKMEVNDFLPMQGKSVGELAGESRSEHKSQGFGVSRQFGSALEYFATIQGEAPKSDLMDGVNTSWSRVQNSDGIEAMIDNIITGYNPADPSTSVPALNNLLAKLRTINPMNQWVKTKMEEVQKILLACAGVYVEATTQQPAILNGDSVSIKLTMINRSNFPCNVRSVSFASGTAMDINKPLAYNQLYQTDLKTVVAEGMMETQPYWLRTPPSTGMFDVKDQDLIGMAENKPLSVKIRLTIDSAFVTIERPVQYRSIDPVKAEQYNPVYVSNPFLVYNDPAVLLFRKGQKDSATIDINIIALKNVSLEAPQVSLLSDSNSYKKSYPQPAWKSVAGDNKTVKIKVPNYLNGTGKEIDLLETAFKPGGSYGDATFVNARRAIEYEHIPTQTWHYQDKIKVLNIDLKTVGKKIGYIPGAGDKVIDALQQMGYEVTTLNPSDLVFAKLKQYDAVIAGVRAYNVHDWLTGAYDALMQYVQNGGNLIAQYNTNSNIGPVKAKMAPYAMDISRNRITDETAAVNFTLPNHPALNFPNKITAKDFEGWVQERSIYHAEKMDSNFVAPISMADPGEPANNGALVIAPYGRGNFVYTGLVFFRELPAGVPGAYRLMANLIALPKNNVNSEKILMWK
jgi:LmbE family N-acetylglucosaminyl deacetylase